MRKRRCVLALVALAVVVWVGGLARYTLSPRPCVTPGQCERIRPGMTLDEVVAILGCPPGNHTAFPEMSRTDGTEGGFGVLARPDCQDWFVDCGPPHAHKDGLAHWYQAMEIRVQFDKHGRVCGVWYYDGCNYLAPTPIDSAKLWLANLSAKLGF